MSLSAAAAIEILQSRYDFLSARIVLKQAAETAGLDPKGKFDGADIGKLADAVAQVGDRVDAVVAKIRDAGSGKTESKAAPKAEPEPEAKPDAKAEPAAEAKADDAKDDAKDAPAKGGKQSGRRKK